MKKFFIGGFIGLVAVAGLYAASNIFTDRFTVTGTGSLSNNSIIYLDDDYDFYIQEDGTTPDFSVVDGTVAITENMLIAKSILMGGSYTTAVATTATSGSSDAIQYMAYLKGSATWIAASEGSVLCATTTETTSQYVSLRVCAATLDQNDVVGVAAAAASTGTFVFVNTTGWTLALTTGTVVAGSGLTTSNDSAGYFEQVAAATNTIAISLGVGTSGGGLTRVKIK